MFDKFTQGGRGFGGGGPADFRSASAVPDSVPVYGPFTIGGFLNVLDNAGEKLVLSRPGGAGPSASGPMFEVDRVRYDEAAPWPVLPATGLNATTDGADVCAPAAVVKLVKEYAACPARSVTP